MYDTILALFSSFIITIVTKLTFFDSKITLCDYLLHACRLVSVLMKMTLISKVAVPKMSSGNEDPILSSEFKH